MLEQALQEILKIVKKEFNRQLQLQGHNLTGKLAQSVEQKITTTFDGFIIDFEALAYGNIINRGVPANRIPFSPGSGKKTSKYIDGLKKFAKLRFGAGDKEAQSIAFAIAYTQKKQGLPTKGSFQFSKNGKRTGFIDDTLESVEPLIEKIIEDTIFNFIQGFNLAS